MENIVFFASAPAFIISQTCPCYLDRSKQLAVWTSVELSDKVVKNVDTISALKKPRDINKAVQWPFKQRTVM